MPQLELFSPVREQEDLSKKKEAKEDREKKQPVKAGDTPALNAGQLSPGILELSQDDNASHEDLHLQPGEPENTPPENANLLPGEPGKTLEENQDIQHAEAIDALQEQPTLHPEKAENASPEISAPQPEEPANTTLKKSNIHSEQTGNAVVFSDGKISVKIKRKEQAPEVVITPEKELLPAPEEKEQPLKPLHSRGRRSFKEIDATADLVEVPEDEILFQKQYYAISTVAEWFKVNTSLLRFWENEFDILKPRKNRKGDRMFRPEDVKNLQLIHHLLRHRKYTINGAKEYLKSNKSAADAQLQLTQTLQKFKLFLLELKANL